MKYILSLFFVLVPLTIFYTIAQADSGSVVPISTESYEVPITVNGSTFTLTIEVKDSNVVAVTTGIADVGVGAISKITKDKEYPPEVSSTIYAIKNFPKFPIGNDGVVDVVSMGPYIYKNETTKIHVVIRNNTDEIVYGANLEGEAYDPNDNLLGFGKNLHLTFPRVIKPGQISAGIIYFLGMEITEKDTVKMSVTYSSVEDLSREYALAIDDSVRPNRTKDSIMGTLSNPNDIPVQMSWINLLCFDTESGQIYTKHGKSSAKSLDPGESASFQIFSDCESYIISATGRKR
ncbi:hypothetical protein KFU94_52545 [Chloroflexi bacterium TSY]|nr:hypothetical protein [Chloroflexi bacterium TSY]